MTRTVFRGGNVVTTTGIIDADLLVVDECVAVVGKDLEVTDAVIVDVTGRYLLPGT